LAALARILCVLVVTSYATSARAAGECEERAKPWILACAERAKLDIVLRGCPERRLVVGVPSASLDVEMVGAEVKSFHQVGAIGLSPIGDFPNWENEPDSPQQKAFQAIEDCVRADGAVPLGSPQKTIAQPRPWLLGLGLLFALALAFVSVKSKKQLALGLAAFVIATAAVLFLRKLLLPFAFFHQNGIGPSWVDVARNAHRTSEYGPGFAELFEHVTSVTGRRPERGMFWLSAVIGATVPGVGFLGARALGATRVVAAIVFFGLAFDPVLARVAQSESYFGIIIALGAAAATALLVGCFRPEPRSARFVLGVLTSGALIAQAARVHPIGWIPLALVPLVVLLGPRLSKRRVVACVIAGLGIAVIVGIATGPALFAVVRGTLGAHWMDRAGPHRPFSGLTVPIVAISLCIAWLLGRRRGWTAGAIAFASLMIGSATDLLSEPNPAIHAAFLRLQLPVLVPVAAMWVDRLTRQRRRIHRARFAPLVFGGLVAVSIVTSWSGLTRLPTDAREAEFALEWRERLEPGSVVVYVEHAGYRNVRLPLYDQVTNATRRGIAVGEPLPDLSRLGGTLYYYRSSLCVTDDAKAACQAIEATAPLELVTERELPAIPSMRWSQFPSDKVMVGLYRRR
jgi:hypothetical protein